MAYELTGKLIIKEETNVISERFKKREFVVLKEENNAGTIFTDHVKFQLVQDKCDLIEDVQLEDEITVSFNIRGNKWEKNGNTSYFTNLDAWRIVKAEGGSDAPAPAAPAFPKASDETFSPDGDEEDLPF